MITFEAHQKNADHFYSVGARIFKKIDEAGLLTAYNGKYIHANRGFRLTSVEANDNGTATLEAMYWCGDSQETNSIDIPISLMDMDNDLPLLSFIADQLEIKAAFILKAAENDKAEARRRDEEELARIQARLAKA